MKEHGKIPQDQTNDMEICNLPEKEFRKMIVKMIQNLGKRIEAQGTPWWSMVRMPHFYFRGRRFDLWSGN